jgi:hypothetical protein
MNEERTDQKPDCRVVPFHPVLFAVAPILFVYAYNGTKIPIDPGELLKPIALSLVMTAVLWTILGFLFRSATRAAIVASLFLVLFFSYGHVAEAFGPKGQAWTELLLFWAMLLAAGTWLAARRLRPAAQGSQFGVTVLLNCIATVILLLNLPNDVRAYTHGPPHVVHASKQVAAANGRDCPDIYYIITDAYARSDLLKSRYRTDNSAFLDELAHLGFFVADRARSNYVQTYLSLASSLNFTYLDSLAGALGQEFEDHSPLVEMIQSNRLVGFLRRRGYSIVSFASGYDGTDLAGADVHFAPRWSLSEFQFVLANTTLLRDALGLLRTSPATLHRDRVLYTLRNLPAAASGRHPVFVWAHLDSPHSPFVFDARGDWPVAPRALGGDGKSPWLNQTLGTVNIKWYDEFYGPQVTHLSTLLADVVRRILAQSPRPPIIVIQGDHGPGSVPDWDRLTREQVLEQPDILYAVYLPQSDARQQSPVGLYDSITPVNTFRVILSRFFDTTMTLRPDRSYFSTFRRPYRFYDADHPESFPAIGGPAGSIERP